MRCTNGLTCTVQAWSQSTLSPHLTGRKELKPVPTPSLSTSSFPWAVSRGWSDKTHGPSKNRHGQAKSRGKNKTKWKKTGLSLYRDKTHCQPWQLPFCNKTLKISVCSIYVLFFGSCERKPPKKNDGVINCSTSAWLEGPPPERWPSKNFRRF